MRCNLQGLRIQGFRVEIFGSVFTIVGFWRALSDLIRVLFVVYRVVGLAFSRCFEKGVLKFHISHMFGTLSPKPLASIHSS